MQNSSSLPLLWSQPYLSFSLRHPTVLLRSSGAELMPPGCPNVIHISQGKYPDGSGPIPTHPGGELAQSCGPHDPTQQDQVPSTVNAYAVQSLWGGGRSGCREGLRDYGSRARLSVAAGECSPGSPSRSQHFDFLPAVALLVFSSLMSQSYFFLSFLNTDITLANWIHEYRTGL